MSRVPCPYCGRASATNASASASTSSTPFAARRAVASKVTSVATSSDRRSASPRARARTTTTTEHARRTPRAARAAISDRRSATRGYAKRSYANRIHGNLRRSEHAQRALRARRATTAGTSKEREEILHRRRPARGIASSRGCRGSSACCSRGRAVGRDERLAAGVAAPSSSRARGSPGSARARNCGWPKSRCRLCDVDLVAVADLDGVDLHALRLARGASRTRAEIEPAFESPSVSRMIAFERASLRRRRATAVPTASPIAVPLPSMTSSSILPTSVVSSVVVERRRREHVRVAPKTTTPMRSVFRRAMKSRMTSFAVSRRVEALVPESRRPSGSASRVHDGAHRAREIEHDHDVDPGSSGRSSRSTFCGRASASEREHERRRRGARRANRGGTFAQPRGPCTSGAIVGDAQARHARVRAERHHDQHDRRNDARRATSHGHRRPASPPPTRRRARATDRHERRASATTSAIAVEPEPAKPGSPPARHFGASARRRCAGSFALRGGSSSCAR